MRQLYTIFYCLLTPWLFIRLLIKSRRLPVYRQRIGERFGFFPQQHASVDIWLHAVSFGEVNAALPLIKSLLQNRKRLLITTMTPTGSARVIEIFQNTVQHVYIPYEYPWALSRFFKTYQPRLGIIFETELWPNMLAYAHRADMKLLLLNARLSERSFKGYCWIRALIRQSLNTFYGIHAQTAADAQRFIQLGAKPQSVQVSGNIKFDLILPSLDFNGVDALPARFGRTRLVVIAASTHEGEESALLSALKTFQTHSPDVLLVIAPRHPERFARVNDLSQQMGYRTALRSQLETLNEQTEVLIIDTLGELLSCFTFSHYAFVGGSLVDIGGHNVLEPMAIGIPVMIGRYVRNCQSLCTQLAEADALTFVDSAEAFFERVHFLQTHPKQKQLMLQNAAEILRDNRGVLTRYCTLINMILAS